MENGALSETDRCTSFMYIHTGMSPPYSYESGGKGGKSSWIFPDVDRPASTLKMNSVDRVFFIEWGWI